MLLTPEDWAVSKEQRLEILGLPGEARAFLEPILAGVSVGLSALAEAADGEASRSAPTACCICRPFARWTKTSSRE